MNKKIDGQIFKQMIISGSNNLFNQKNRIDALNVFPVPDGDTGTNMASTAANSANEIKNNSSTNLAEISAAVSKGMLFGARGNSGVILSQIFKGISLGFEGKESADANLLLEAFKKATEKAYQSVLKPVEGTILTVIRETTEQLTKSEEAKESVETFFKKAYEFAKESCKNTPNKLKVLREVGVTDSGGEGFLTILEGMYKFLESGKVIEKSDIENDPNKFISDDEVFEGEFGYCTEFIIELENPEEFDKKDFEKKLNKKATSLVIVQDNEIVKVHGHTLKPGELLNFAQKYGEFIKIKSENMSLQASESRNKKNSKQQSNSKNLTKCGIVSCNLGNGIINRMQEFGCDAIIESGQTQNPSAQDIVDAINSVNAENIFVLPNNKNIFLAAEQAAQIINDKKVFIIPTKSQAQGFTALLNFDADATAEENKDTLNEAIKLIKSGEVTQSIRTTKIDGIKIKEGEFIAIYDSKIVAAKNSYISATKELIKKAITEDSEIITIYYGNDASEDDANEIKNFVESNYDVEIEIINGNQPHYHFIIGFE
ncbi:DAK2 domain-containing protein [Mycoplasma sp. Mirounga ES2805-ORL]|uniref:DAK2 domain-containing protein n=1 Tax=Mycoplasma sp. Mirounga ES2805-ORL TaxID=754514 RepID=UPI00197B8C20|nr:DAK2 domain-containing protein [Mycoplasma sp. Mirounga ES2805-ORL]QSF13906.1 DAK2 domain-containing protein [Mycoplasma sp. Mirounga ES2805-ORL]